MNSLQSTWVDSLQSVGGSLGLPTPFTPVHWVRDEGRHGGGVRRVAGESQMLGRASVNVSAIQYDDLPEKRLSSATALSTIVHPTHPRAPSMHMHISWTEMRDGKGYWRVMADLNPSMPNPDHTQRFLAVMKAATPEHFAVGNAQGDKYFAIPSLDRHRGVAHFYLEGHNTGDWAADAAMANHFGTQVIACYASLIQEAFEQHDSPTESERAAQLAYHTLYLFQVLTLDRGTTSGLLVHSQNDLGIMGSLPARADRALLASWRSKVPAVQIALVDDLVDALTDVSPSPIDADAKLRLAQAVRAHYQAHPEALSLQASGNVVPPTVDNHK